MPTLQDTVITLENYLVNKLKSLNTFRTKRESTYNVFVAVVAAHLGSLIEGGTITSYMLDLKQSGRKQMGMYVVGNIGLVADGETFDMAVKLRMPSWKESKAVRDANKVAQPEPSAA